VKSLIYNGERLEAEKIIKKTDAIIGYIGDTEVFSFKGISDWSIFAIEAGTSILTLKPKGNSVLLTLRLLLQPS